jgi:hypothetical protein
MRMPNSEYARKEKGSPAFNCDEIRQMSDMWGVSADFLMGKSDIPFPAEPGVRLPRLLTLRPDASDDSYLDQDKADEQIEEALRECESRIGRAIPGSERTKIAGDALALFRTWGRVTTDMVLALLQKAASGVVLAAPSPPTVKPSKDGHHERRPRGRPRKAKV